MISKSMKLFSITSVLAILSLTAFSYCAPDTTIKVLHPDEKQIEVSRQVASLIANYNYKKVPIGDSLSRLIVLSESSESLSLSFSPSSGSLPF